jgi:hypothetical protein
VEVGFFSFTEVPHHADRAYDEWHQLDHLPEQYQLPGIAHGERWAASPDCVAARLVDDELLGRASYVTLYLIGPPVDETIDAFGALGAELRAAGRFHEERTAVMAGGWRVTATATSPRLPITPAVIPWRPAAGVFVLVEEDSPDAPPADALLGVEGVAGAWTFAPDPDLTRSWWLLLPYRITVLWLDADPVAVTDALAPALHDRWSGGPARPVYAGPLRTLTPLRGDAHRPGTEPGVGPSPPAGERSVGPRPERGGGAEAVGAAHPRPAGTDLGKPGHGPFRGRHRNDPVVDTSPLTGPSRGCAARRAAP